ncbi:MAG TPA: glutamyl-tRNA reductase [Prolixibacteraceae bacterium]|nr:glutamyl-tRNA reductase [Prolixibacteraceae bacterium]
MIGLIGLNHKSAPIEIREKFVFCEEDVRRFVPQLKAKGIRGAVVVSTCNRTEIYFEMEDNCLSSDIDMIGDTLINYRKVASDVKIHFYQMKNEDAVHHLFRVVSGLDSMALGEYQIVGQIKDAFNISKQNELCSSVLFKLFNDALKTGKQVRTETALNKGAVSISYAGVELAGKKLQNLSSHSVLLVGAGQTSELTLLNLIKKECNQFTVVNRTQEKACELAEKYHCKVGDFEQLGELLVKNDIVISSTASKKALFSEEMVRKAMEERNNQPLLFIDLSVPRNVAKEVGDIENVHVYDIDALNEVIGDNLDMRKGEINHAEFIIKESVSEFSKWHAIHILAPTFQNITSQFQEVNKAMLDGLKNKKEIDHEKASIYGELITKRFIGLMIENVKSVTNNGQKQEYITMVNKLFDLN